MSHSARCRRWLAISVLALGTLVPAGEGLAASDELMMKLMEELRRRDDMIMRLERRVEALEEKLSGGSQAPPGAAAASLNQPARASTGALPAGAEVPPPAAAAPPAGPAPAAQAASAPEPQGAPAAPRPGGLDVDPEAAERALERTLTETGNLLLPANKLEVSPFASYQYSDDRNGVRIVRVDGNGDGVAETVVSDPVRFRRDEIDAGAEVRLGLPYDTQIEARVPVTLARVRTDGTLFPSSRSDSAGGLGDISVGVAKTLLREDGWQPDVIGRVTYVAPTGPGVRNGVQLDSDFHRIGGSISLLKRQDPVAFSARFEYEHAFEKDGVKPGGQFGASFGAFLAVSPETSLSLGLSASRQGELAIGGDEVPGSEELSASATFGASTILHRNVLLNLSVGIGLTDDAPDFGAFVSVPIRFDAW